MVKHRALPSSPPPACSLSELGRQYRHCRQCPLADARRRTVPGAGRDEGAILLLSDRVSGLEEADGHLLAGTIGSVIDRILAAPKVGIPSDAVYVAAPVLCRAPRDRFPRPAEVTACRPRLAAEIALVRPVMIVALGRRAAQALFPDGSVAADAWGWCTWVHGGSTVPVYRTLHPRDAVGGPEPVIRRRKRMMYAHWQAISARFCHLSRVRPVDSA